MQKGIIVFMILFMISCQSQKKVVIEKLFSFNIGYDEKELGFFTKKNQPSSELVHFYYKSGFYYITDAINNKVIKLTEKGEPILTIYNKENYPNLIPTKSGENDQSGDDQIIYIKLYKQYNVQSPCLISVDMQRNIYFVNKIESNVRGLNQTEYQEFITKFNGKGDFLYQLGKSGINGPAFNSIFKVINDSLDQLIVLEHIKAGIKIYRFSEQGQLLDEYTIHRDAIPITDDEIDYIVDFNSFIPGYLKDELYVTCQFINQKKSDFSITHYDTVYEKIFRYSLESGKFEQLLLKVTPEYEDLSRYDNRLVKEYYGDKKQVMKPLDTLLGLDEEKKIFLYQSMLPIHKINEKKLVLKIYHPDGRLLNHNLIAYPDDADFYSNLFVSPDGRIFLYYIRNKEINFAKIHY